MKVMNQYIQTWSDDWDHGVNIVFDKIMCATTAQGKQLIKMTREEAKGLIRELKWLTK